MKSHGYQSLSYKYAFDKYWLSYGYYLAAIFWFKYVKPSVVVVSNDHNMVNRAILRAAMFLDIPTVYIQHASVTEKFPSLRVNYALLEGLDALEKYQEIGCWDTTVYLVGVPKLDNFINSINSKNSLQSLGVCCNKLDSAEDVENLVKGIRENFPTLCLSLRPHPSDIGRLGFWKALCEKYQMKYSDPINESSYLYLSKIDSIVSGASNILLEAALLNIYPLCFSVSTSYTDHYGFIKNGSLWFH
jgi:hypothetical protein